jgi:hypothetical protein
MVKINLMGDVMFGELLENYRRGLKTVLEKREIDPFEHVRSVLEEADLNLINLECVFSDTSILEKPFSEILISPERFLRFLTENNINVVNTANNHALDHGRKQFERSLRLLKESGIHAIGYGAGSFFQDEPVVVDTGGQKIGFLGYNISNFPDADRRSMVDRIKAVVAGSRQTVDKLVVSMHWGEEYTNIPPQYVVEFGKELIGAGVDIIHGHHSHQIQGVVRIGNSIFAPSLGNFIFDQKVARNRITAVLRVEMAGDGELDFRYVPYHMNDLFQPESAPEYEGYIEELNGYLSECLDGKAEKYAKVIKDNVSRGHRDNRIRMRAGMLAHFWHYLSHLGRIIAFRRSGESIYSFIKGEDCLKDACKDGDSKD